MVTSNISVPPLPNRYLMREQDQRGLRGKKIECVRYTLSDEGRRFRLRETQFRRREDRCDIKKVAHECENK